MLYFTAHFKDAQLIYNSGSYMIMPIYATLHLQFMILRLELCKVFTYRDKRYYKREFNSGKKDLEMMLLYYVKIAYRYWRPARDNWCLRDKIIGEIGDSKKARWNHIQCISQPPLYRLDAYCIPKVVFRK